MSSLYENNTSTANHHLLNQTVNTCNSNKNNITRNHSAIIYKSKVSPSRRLKNLLKPILGRIFKFKANKNRQKRNSYVASEDNETEYEWLSNDMDNRANEHLENQLIEELHQCEDGAAIVVYNEDGTRRLETIDKDEIYVPVHFARTNAGTFFWTSIRRETMEPFQIEWNFMDRWAQA